MPPPPPRPKNLSLSITNPLVLYRALVATKKIKPDPAQHRLALQLQKLYFRLKDYSPEVEYRYRLEKIGRSVGRRSGSGSGSTGASSTDTGIQTTRTHDGDGAQQQNVSSNRAAAAKGRSNNSSNSILSRSLAVLASSTKARLDPSSLALTRTTPLHQSALQIDSPLGLLLYGEVGRGKSMLLDLLYDSLPSRKKRRWHFTTFMLDVYRRIELERTERVAMEAAPELDGGGRRRRSMFGGDQGQTVSDHENVVLSLARDTICDSPILFLDEFQMPDRTASKLVGSFFTSFFHLGGVLVASSNRMPEELSKAAGIEFAALRRGTTTTGAGGFWGLGWGIGRETEGEKSAKTDFGLFLDVLRARCEVWEMEGEKDWRREADDVDQDGGLSGLAMIGQSDTTFDNVVGTDMRGTEGGSDGIASDDVDGAPKDNEHGLVVGSSTDITNETTPQASSDAPPHYHVSIPSVPSSSFETDLRSLNPQDEWTPTHLTIYARQIHLPHTHKGILKSSFSDLCATYLGPADYVSLCSTFHTLVLTDVPVLTLTQKNEARRFITLLDALYEAKCRVLIEAEAPPDKLFFPEMRRRTRAGVHDDGRHEGDDGGNDETDSITSEAYSEIYQDSTAPFRPNVSIYNDGNVRSSEPDVDVVSFTASLGDVSRRSVLADEDADFGPTYGNGRGRGISRADSAEDAMSRRQATSPDFTTTSALTGEDERFAYKRARSRLWEMCGNRWWSQRTLTDDEGEGENGTVMDWWRPIGREGRTWERFRDQDLKEEVLKRQGQEQGREQNKGGSESHQGPERANDDAKTDSLFKHGASPFRTSTSPPPKFGWQHAWGMMKWGKKAGRWGRGVDGFVNTRGTDGGESSDQEETGKRR
ncbi:uncharacterized protein PV06_09960 [Exophiala oligosperma]|uniref:AAA+ ATPase domain-containing protein n=1 Tax=Exophiala oligosperma TaxID=215243 RepID=A0A0D2D421_9EURO|nr:uncharacterized protein PV06_09960 [Exophiala oligosperma]KIW37983.1 hypothetical protein PV06_09960 [Exophiala oligosperma]